MLCWAVAECACNFEVIPSADAKHAHTHKPDRSPTRKQGNTELPPLLALRAPIRAIEHPAIIDIKGILFSALETSKRLRSRLLKSQPPPHHPQSADRFSYFPIASAAFAVPRIADTACATSA